MTKEEHVQLSVQDDFLAGQTRAHPLTALSELIWNGLDADATSISVELKHDDLAGGLSQIAIYDNGDGFPRADARALFGNLGGSWKRLSRRSRRKGRMIHGQEGRGRYKALALGRSAVWKVCYKSQDVPMAFEVRVSASDLTDIVITEESPAPGRDTGVVVQIFEPHKDYRAFTSEEGIQELTEAFALYLLNYRDVSIRIAGEALQPSNAISSHEQLALPAISTAEGASYPVELELVEWKAESKRILYLCSDAGFPFDQVEARFHVPGFSFSAYLKSQFIEVLQKQNRLGLAEMDPALLLSVEEARIRIKDVYRARTAERSKSVVDEWIEQKVYPYVGDATSPVEKMERQVFDIVAVQVQKLTPEMGSVSQKAKALHLRMLRNAIERGPEELQLIFREVLDLPPKLQKDFASLLQETTLAAMITATKTVADRLKFIAALESIVFDPETKERLKERTQLHRILAENTWVFGEEYNLWVSDKDLRRVLNKHKEHLDPGICIDDPVKVIDKKRGIIDLMFSRATRRHRANDLEHMIVELKAPKVVIGSDAIVQAKKYAMAVCADERFHTVSGIKWHFWVVSNRYDEFTSHEIEGGPDPERRLIFRKKNVSVGIKCWSELIEENRARLQFFQEQLRHSADENAAIRHVQERHAQLLEGVFDDDPGQGDAAEAADGDSVRQSAP